MEHLDGDMIDQSRENSAVEHIKSALRRTFINRRGRIGAVLQDLGGYANLIDMGDYALAITTDGVGSKVLVAQALCTYDTIGIDCVAMNVNDIICCGAEPISMVDYIAMQNINSTIAKDIARGLAKGADEAGISIVGGETASLPDVINGIDGMGFDLAATCIGIVAKDKIITGDNIKVGDVVLGLPSSGVHSNGLTLARDVLPKNMWVNLLVPSRIYVREIMTLLSEFKINGMAHITGGGFLNLTRLTRHGFVLDNMPSPPAIIKRIQEMGGLSEEEMFRTFNMGVGFCIIVSEVDAQLILDKYGKDMSISAIGRVIGESGVTIVNEDSKFKLKRTMYG